MDSWGERERAPPLMMSTALASVRPSSYVSQTAHAQYSRDIIMRLVESVQTQTVTRDWNDVDNRNGRDVLEKRQRRETEGAVFETGKKTGSMCFCACAA